MGGVAEATAEVAVAIVLGERKNCRGSEGTYGKR
jgi:hypothetical protein